MPNYPYSFQLPPLNVQDIPSNGAVGEFLGINGSGVLDWLPVAAGGGDMLKADNLSGLANYTTARTNIGLGTTDSPTFANLTLTSPSLSSSAPVTISQTWNNAAVAFTGLKVNAVSTASASGSLLLDLQLGGLRRFTIQKDGWVNIGASDVGSAIRMLDLTNQYGNVGFQVGGGGRLDIMNGGSTVMSLFSGGAMTLSGTSVFMAIGNNVILARDGADNTLALRNGAAAQTFRIYNTTDTGVTTYERAALGFSSNVFRIGTENLAGVTAPRDICLNSGTGTTQIAGSGGNSMLTFPVSLGGTNTGKVGYFGGAFEVGSIIAAPLRLITSNLTRVTVSDAGNVGIGTTAPGAKLDIGNGGDVVTEYTSQYALSYKTGGFRHYVQSIHNNTPTGNGIFFWLNSANTAAGSSAPNTGNILGLALNSGNVGIGTTAPSTLLHIHKDQSTDTELRVQNSSDLLSATATINLIGSQGSTLVLQANSTTVAAPDATRASIKSTANVFGLNLKAESTVGTLQFYTGGGAVANERLRITAAGNVGIGTTSPTSKLHVAETWNAAGTTFAAAKIVITDTASASDSNLLELWSGATPSVKLSVRKDGAIVLPYNYAGIIDGSANSSGTNYTWNGPRLGPLAVIGWTAGSPGGTTDTILLRDSASGNTLALRNGINPQTFRVYNTYSNAGIDVEYLQLSTSASGFRIGTNSSGSGSSRPLFLGVGGGSQWQINTAGHIGTFGSDNLYDIGASGANRPRNLFVGTSIIAGSSITCAVSVTVGGGGYLFHGSQAAIGSSGTARHTLFDAGGTFYDRLQIGGTSASFPAIKRVGTELQIVIASTSAAAGVAAGDADLTFIEDRYRRKGAGTPEGVVTAPIGAVYHNTTGGAGTSFYVKESGTGNTGWVGK